MNVGTFKLYPLCDRTSNSLCNNHSTNILFISTNYWTFSKSTEKIEHFLSLRFCFEYFHALSGRVSFSASLVFFGINRIIIWKDWNNGVVWWNIHQLLLSTENVLTFLFSRISSELFKFLIVVCYLTRFFYSVNLKVYCRFYAQYRSKLNTFIPIGCIIMVFIKKL